MLAQLRALPQSVKLAIAVVAGLLAALVLYAALRKYPKKERMEASGIGGVAVAVIVWLLLQTGVTNITQAGDVNFEGVPVTYSFPIRPGADYLFDFPPPSDDNWYVNLPPVTRLYPPPRPQAQTNCGCDQANDALSEFWRGLWDTLYAAGLYA